MRTVLRNVPIGRFVIGDVFRHPSSRYVDHTYEVVEIDGHTVYAEALVLREIVREIDYAAEVQKNR